MFQDGNVELLQPDTHLNDLFRQVNIDLPCFYQNKKKHWTKIQSLNFSRVFNAIFYWFLWIIFFSLHIIFSILETIRNNFEASYPELLLQVFPYFHYPLLRLIFTTILPLSTTQVNIHYYTSTFHYSG